MGAGASKKTAAGGGSPKGTPVVAPTPPIPATLPVTATATTSSTTTGSSPAVATTTTTSIPQPQSLRVGSSCVQGHRPYQEDRISIHHPLVMPDGKVDHTISFFGVFDGHGGSWAAEYAVKRLHAFVAKEKDLLPSSDACDGPVPIELAILRAFHDFDQELSLQSDEGAQSTGTTAAVALIDKDYIYVGNAGDSRCVLCNDFQAQCLTIDHKPTDESELQRIEAAGGRVPNKYVELEDRGLAVSRALGDLFFKRNKSVGVEQQVVISTPHLQRIKRSSNDQFLLLASDGLWNVMSEQQACDFVLRTRQAPTTVSIGIDGVDASAASAQGLSTHLSAAFMESMDDSCSRLTQRALDLRSKDNISVLLIELNGALSPAPAIPVKPKPNVKPLGDDSIAKAAGVGEAPQESPTAVMGGQSRRAIAAAAASASSPSHTGTSMGAAGGSTVSELKVEYKHRAKPSMMPGTFNFSSISVTSDSPAIPLPNQPTHASSYSHHSVASHPAPISIPPTSTTSAPSAVALPATTSDASTTAATTLPSTSSSASSSSSSVPVAAPSDTSTVEPLSPPSSLPDSAVSAPSITSNEAASTTATSESAATDVNGSGDSTNTA